MPGLTDLELDLLRRPVAGEALFQALRKLGPEHAMIVRERYDNNGRRVALPADLAARHGWTVKEAAERTRAALDALREGLRNEHD